MSGMKIFSLVTLAISTPGSKFFLRTVIRFYTNSSHPSIDPPSLQFLAMSTKHTVLHLRSEQKPLEHRSALTPTTTKALINAGYEVHVERSPKDPSRKRIYDDEEFEQVGAKLVDDQS